MQKATRDNGGCIAIAVSRFGSDPIAVKLENDLTVRAALDAAGVTLAAREVAYVDGEAAHDDDILDDGDVVAIVTPKQAGNR